MKKVNLAILTAIAGLSLSAISTSTLAMDKHVERALVKICKSAASNRINKMNRSIKEFNLRHKTVALRVMCNGQDIINFAENSGAFKTAGRLQRSIGGVEIIDVATLHKSDTTFVE